MSGTVYLKLEKNVQIHSRIVSFKDIAQIVADDSALENKIRVLKLPPDTVQGPGRYPVSVMTLIELIQQEFPGIEVNNIGEADFILTLEKKKQPGGLYAWCKTALVALIAFFGAAFAIMTFNNDVDIPKLFGRALRTVHRAAIQWFYDSRSDLFHRYRPGCADLFQSFYGEKADCGPDAHGGGDAGI